MLSREILGGAGAHCRLLCFNVRHREAVSGIQSCMLVGCEAGKRGLGCLA